MVGAGGGPSAYLPRQRAGRFCANARTPSRRSSEAKQARRSSISSASMAGSSVRPASSSSRSTRLLPAIDSGDLRPELGAADLVVVVRMLGTAVLQDDDGDAARRALDVLLRGLA